MADFMEQTVEQEEKYLVSKGAMDELLNGLRRTRQVFKEESIDGREWKICDDVLGNLESIVKVDDGSKTIEKEVVLDTFIYVPVNNADRNGKSEEKIIDEAKDKIATAMDKAGVEVQIFGGKYRDIE